MSRNLQDRKSSSSSILSCLSAVLSSTPEEETSMPKSRRLSSRMLSASSSYRAKRYTAGLLSSFPRISTLLLVSNRSKSLASRSSSSDLLWSLICCCTSIRDCKGSVMPRSGLGTAVTFTLADMELHKVLSRESRSPSPSPDATAAAVYASLISDYRVTLYTQEEFEY
ncbi:hypothetical protein C8J56DRAFT_401472 [Mycena floridula]|nr:hypothetical protein C8J56DRAFT_401472 [Mycena floridula]